MPTGFTFLVVSFAMLLWVVPARISAGNAITYSDYTSMSSWGDVHVDSAMVVGFGLAIVTTDLNGDGFDDVVFAAREVTCDGTIEFVIAAFVQNSSVFRRQLNPFPTYSGSQVVDMTLLSQPNGGSLENVLTCDLSGALHSFGNLGNFTFSDFDAVTFAAGGFPCNGTSRFASADVDNNGYIDVLHQNNALTAMLIMQPNGTLLDRAASYFLSGVPVHGAFCKADFGHINSDGYIDLAWSGLDTVYGTYFTQLWRNVNGSSFSGIISGSTYYGYSATKLDDWTGDGIVDMIVTGLNLISSAYTHTAVVGFGNFTFASSPSLSFGLNLGLATILSVDLSPSVPGRDLVITGYNTTSFTTQSSRVLINNGTGTFTEATSSILPSYPYGFSATPVRLGSQSFDQIFGGGLNYDFILNSMQVFYVDSGSLISTTSSSISYEESLMSLPYTSASLVDINYDGCLDAHFQGWFGVQGVAMLTTGDCTGVFTASSTQFPFYYNGFAFFEDLDGDDLLEFFASGLLSPTSATSTLYTMDSLGNPVTKDVNATFPGFLPVSSSYAVTCELTGDALPEVLVRGTSTTKRFFAYRNIGGLAFLSMASAFSPAVAVPDDGPIVCVSGGMPGYSNVILAGGNGTGFPYFEFYWNLGNGTLSLVPTPSVMFGAPAMGGINRGSGIVGDLDADGFDDIILVGYENDVSINAPAAYLYRGLGNGTLSLVPGALPASVGLYDGDVKLLHADDDQLLDAVFEGSSLATSMQFRLVLNNGNGTFTDATSQLIPSGIGFHSGAIAVGAVIPNATQDAILAFGFAQTCGFRMLAVPVTAVPNATMSTSSSSNSGGSDGGSSATLAAAIGGSIGGVAFLLLLAVIICCLICCCCCLICIVFVVVLVALLLLLVIAVMLIGGVVVVDGGIVAAFALKRKGGDSEEATEERDDEVALEELVERSKNTNAFSRIDPSEVTVVRRLGAGAFGEVLLAEWNGVQIALKTFRNPTKEAIADFEHEALMMAKVSHHPNVVRLVGAVFAENYIGLAMVFCAGGSLQTALEHHQLSDAAKTVALLEVASALAFLHDVGVVHRDIASRNVLLDATGRSKLADLGLSRVLEDKQGEQMTASTIGPVRWMAPESITKKLYSAASDCYAFAMLMLEVWTDGQPPFADVASLADLAMRIVREDARPSVPDTMPTVQERLMRQLWARDPSERPTMAEVIKRLGSDSSSAPSHNAAGSATGAMSVSSESASHFKSQYGSVAGDAPGGGVAEYVSDFDSAAGLGAGEYSATL